MEFTVNNLRKLIKTKKLNDFIFQDYIKFFAENLPTMSLGAEMAFKEYIRKGAEQLNIDLRDVQGVYNSYKPKKTEK